MHSAAKGDKLVECSSACLLPLCCAGLDSCEYQAASVLAQQVGGEQASAVQLQEQAKRVGENQCVMVMGNL